MIETKKVTDRRRLHFTRMSDILADVDALDGPDLRTTGNWTPAQDVAHVATIIRRSLDGFDGLKAPLAVRLLVRLVRNKALREPFKPGIQLPEKFRKVFVPDAATTWQDATSAMRHEIGRIENGERMTVPSPVFGALSHEQWVQLHCRHAELHLSFIRVS